MYDQGKSSYTSGGTSTTIMPTCSSSSIGAYATHAWCSFRKYTLELYDRPSAPLELKIRMLRAEVLETMLYGCVTWSPRACHYETLRSQKWCELVSSGCMIRRFHVVFLWYFLNASVVSRPSEHPPVRGKMSKRLLGGIIGCKMQNLFMAFQRVTLGQQ